MPVIQAPIPEKPDVGKNVFLWGAIMVIFVCTANRCRSIVSEYLFRHYLQEGLYLPWDTKLNVSSAGILTDDYWEFLQTFTVNCYYNLNKYAFYNVPPYKQTINCLAGRDWDVSAYRSRPLTEKLVSEARLLVTMEENQKNAILESFPNAAERTLTFREFVGEGEEVIYEDTLFRPQFEPADPHCVYYTRSYVDANYLAIDKGLRNGARQIAEILKRRGELNGQNDSDIFLISNVAG